jgi:DTW domain-containing protein YfiP
MCAPIKLVILQHPDEQKHPLATVPILKACLDNLEVVVGEQFDPTDLSHVDLSTAGLLFPSDNAQEWDMGKSVSSGEFKLQTLIVIDGTWRKAKKIHFEHSWLQELPHILLKSFGPSQYRIRSTKVEGGLSTLETVVQACNYISGSTEFNGILKPFQAMVDMQIKKMGIETFNAHYQDQTGLEEN